MVPVPVTVRLVEVAAFHAVPEPAIVQVPEPTAMLLTDVVLEFTRAPDELNVTLKLAASKVPKNTTNPVEEFV